MEKGIHVVFTPEQIGQIGSLPITNTLLASLCASTVLIILAFVVRSQISTAQPGKMQNFFELLFGYILDYMDGALEDRSIASRFFPLITTIFLFVWFANWMEFLPGFGSILVGEYHLLRGASTDLNMTLGLALIAFVSIEWAGFRSLGLGYIKKFINFSSPLNFFVGLIELISEVARVISFSFRLFGNIFAGEILVMLALTLQTLFFDWIKIPVPVPVPLILFEMGVGIIQAGVFALLTLYFIKLAITSHDH